MTEKYWASPDMDPSSATPPDSSLPSFATSRYLIQKSKMLSPTLANLT
jgi:hypothetical protein